MYWSFAELETLVAHMRCWVVAGMFLSWSLGLVALPASALWLSPNWRYLQLAITAFSVVLLPLLLLVSLGSLAFSLLL